MMSSGSWISGSGTSSTRTSSMPCQVSAFTQCLQGWTCPAATHVAPDEPPQAARTKMIVARCRAGNTEQAVARTGVLGRAAVSACSERRRLEEDHRAAPLVEVGGRQRQAAHGAADRPAAAVRRVELEGGQGLVAVGEARAHRADEALRRQRDVEAEQVHALRLVGAQTPELLRLVVPHLHPELA